MSINVNDMTYLMGYLAIHEQWACFLPAMGLYNITRSTIEPWNYHQNFIDTRQPQTKYITHSRPTSEGSPIFPNWVRQPASLSMWLAVLPRRRGLSRDPGVCSVDICVQLKGA